MKKIAAVFLFVVLILQSGCKSQAVIPTLVPPAPTPILPTPTPGPPTTTPEALNGLTAVSPESVGWSSEKLAEAAGFADEIGSAAVMALYDGGPHGGQVFFSWGEVDRNFPVHSIRKPFLNALYGIHVAKGDIDLDATMAELDINDTTPRLTAEEQSATVRDLLKSRSGVYHEAAGEVPIMEDQRPERGSHPPDTFFYYNNWDFNVLGTIFEQETGIGIFEAFEQEIAGPIGMEDFSVDNCEYHYEYNKSVHPVYRFSMSARDMARFGLLYMRDGRWGDQQIIPSEWIRESTIAYSTIEDSPGIGYGYLWNVVPEGSELAGLVGSPFYFHTGVGVHFLGVIPDQKLVIVHRVNTDEDREFPEEGLNLLVDMILSARLSEETTPGVSNDASGVASGDEPETEDVASIDQDIQTFDTRIEALRKSLNIPGLSAAVVKDGEIIFARGFGYADVENQVPATENTPYHIASLTKPFSAALIMGLIEEGRLDLDAEMADILKDATFQLGDFSINGYADLCEMITALSQDTEGPYAGYRFLFEDYHCDSEPITVRHHLTHTAQGLPGASYRYNGFLYGLLTQVIEQASGKEYETMLVDRITAPLGMTGTYPNGNAQREGEILDRRARPYRLDGNGYPARSAYPEGLNASSGIVSTVLDLAKFSLAMDQNRIVSAGSKAAMVSPTIANGGQILPYGLGWFVQEYDGRKLIWHYGHEPEAYSSLILKVPEEDLAFILLANSAAASSSFNLGQGDVLESAFARAFIELFVDG